MHQLFGWRTRRHCEKHAESDSYSGKPPNHAALIFNAFSAKWQTLQPADGPPESKTAAPVGAGSGGDNTGKLTSVSEAEAYRMPRCDATAAAVLPILTTNFGLSIADQHRANGKACGREGGRP